MGAVPPLTDVVGHLLAARPLVRVRTKHGDVVDIPIDDIVAFRVLGAAPVRTSAIRNIEYAAAMAWPGIEREWLGGWLLRAAGGHTHGANSAVPLLFSAQHSDVAAIVEWYRTRGLPAWLSVPDRLFRLPATIPTALEANIMVREVTDANFPAEVTISARPDSEWMRLYQRQVPLDVLTAVVDGQVVFGSIPGAAVARAAVTAAPDGTRWLGLSGVRVAESQRGQGHGRALCSALLAWGAEQHASHAYVQVLIGNETATALYQRLGFTVHHRSRYVAAAALRRGVGQ